MRIVQVITAIPIALLLFAAHVEARTLFAGSFVEFTAGDSSQRLSLNYPSQDADSMCGFELKTNVLVLHTRVWERLASQLQATERHEDADGRIISEEEVSPLIENLYSPTIQYRFSAERSAYATLEIRTINGNSFAEILAEVFDRDGADLIAVTANCRSAR